MSSTLFPKAITLVRPGAGSYVDGEWTPAADTESTILGSVQPVTSREVEADEGGRISLGSVRIYTDADLKVSSIDGSTAGDKIHWQGRIYEVISEAINDNGLIPHQKYYANYRGLIS
jgi:hypothetical protein